MKKASTKVSTTSASIGTKRTCPECATKFYDFNKDPIHCPKCEAKVDVNALFKPSKSSEPKKAPKKELPEEALMEAEDVVVEGASFESVEDLDDDDDEGVENIEVEDEKEDF